MIRRLPSPLSTDVFVKHWRAVWRSAPVILLLGLYVVFYFLTASEPRFGSAIGWQAAMWTAITALAFVGFAYGIWGAALAFLCAHNVPFVLGYLLMVSVYLGAEFLMMPLVADVRWSISRAGWYFVTSMALGAQIAAIGGFLFERRVRSVEIGKRIDLPIWWPLAADRGDSHEDLLQLLPEKHRGALLRIEAAGQYVVVHTDRGSHELRLPLKRAVERVPEDAGVQVHRSVWLARSQLADLFYRDGNPKIRDTSGRVWPASRSRVAMIKAAMATSGTAAP